MSAITESSTMVTKTAAALSIDTQQRSFLDDVMTTAQIRRGPRSARILPTWDSTLIRVEFTIARGYEGIEDHERTYADPDTAAADVEKFLETGTI